MNAVVAVNAIPAAELLASLRRMGLRVFLGEDGKVKVSPGDRLTLDLSSQIQRMRDGLVQHLAAERRAADQLEARICAMGQRWGYSPEDLQEARHEAQGDPVGWAALCDADELSARQARRAGLSYP